MRVQTAALAVVFTEWATVALAQGQYQMTEASAPRSAAPARDGNIAIREEFEAATKAGTPEALKLFIARHQGHPLAGEAQKALERVTGSGATPRR